ncbi:hypothetical protein HPP92_000416 [Vanilla planifolia]|uniref:PIN-like protein n=1 Tax=Vanilla planifolia TaxID=51239 RepID=A0A835RNS7_VANPL|nr:hypothetical protein HPP92_000416 [Vanilla planifolia]
MEEGFMRTLIRVLKNSVKNSSPSVLLVFKIVCLRLSSNPNFYASFLGITWAIISSRWNIRKPLLMENSITILSNAGLGMAMFSLGLFMAMQPKLIPCGKRLAAYGMLIRFVAGPALMAMASAALGIRDTTLKVSIVQAALPQGIVPFVFAKEYDLHPGDNEHHGHLWDDCLITYCHALLYSTAVIRRN